MNYQFIEDVLGGYEGLQKAILVLKRYQRKKIMDGEIASCIFLNYVKHIISTKRGKKITSIEKL